MNTVAVVPTRGGSQGLPGKNLKVIAGRTLIEIALRQAQRVADRAILVTDSERHADEARRVHADYVVIDREVGPDELPEVKTREAMTIRPDLFEDATTIVRLFCTTPLRSDVDIQLAIAYHRATGRTVVGTSQALFRPHQVLSVHEGRGWRAAPNAQRPRQQVPGREYYINGAVYVASIESFMKYGFWEEPLKTQPINALRALDIDDENDLRAVRALWGVRDRLDTLHL